MTNKELSVEQREELLQKLQARFEKNMNRHEDLEWTNVQAKLEANLDKLWSLHEMEATGGEPDVVHYHPETDDRRYDTIFVYHNGADSYYAARGFRGSLKV